MSTQRNSAPRPSRRRNVAAVIAAVISPIAAMIAACSTDSVTSPTAAPHAIAANVAPTPPPPPKPKPNAKDAANRETPSQLAAEAPTWHTQPGDREAGFDRPLNLACGVAGSWSVSQMIGPNGGVLRFGSSSLTIPQGALNTTVNISARVTLGQAVQIDFAPHGLQFAKAATIVANFSGCTMPAGNSINMYYTDDFGGILQSMPSANSTGSPVVTSLTDHFSGYIVAWGRH